MTIGEYELGERLGTGGMSEVYAATHTRVGSRHALKLFAYPGKGADEVRARFEHEGRLLARLRHPRIVAVSDFGTDASSGNPYFVMDLVTGPEGKIMSLADVPAGGADEETVARWYDDIREGLEYIHRQGIVHRDLKLENVLIGPDGHAVLADFGISRVCRPGAAGDNDPVLALTRVRDGKTPLMGSIGYMAPELELGAKATDKSDWYALGVVVYRLLTGSWCDARTDVVGNLETYDPVWLDIVPKLLHANPDGRECPSFAALREARREAAGIAAETESDRLYAGLRRRGIFVFALSALLAACLAAVGFLFKDGSVLRDQLRRESARPRGGEIFVCPPDMENDDFAGAVGGLLMDQEVLVPFFDYLRGASKKVVLVKALEARRGEDKEPADAEEEVARLALEQLKGLPE